jgi:hypothetical protein
VRKMTGEVRGLIKVAEETFGRRFRRGRRPAPNGRGDLRSAVSAGSETRAEQGHVFLRGSGGRGRESFSVDNLATWMIVLRKRLPTPLRMHRTNKLLVLIGFLLACGTPSVADQGPDRLRVAMIGSDDLRESGAEDVVSASLADEIRDGLVDRTQIDRLRAELDLAAFCLPRAVGERLALGRALGADMLVILRTREAFETMLPSQSGSQIQVVIVDCRNGVRLADRLFDHSPASLETLIPRAIRETCEKYAEGVAQILGLTPLVPEGDQGHIEQLHTGLPNLLAKVLLEQSGVLAIDAEEARLVERERLLGTVPETRAPITIVRGSYRVQFHREMPNRVYVRLNVSQQGEDRGSFEFTLARDDYANVTVPSNVLGSVLAFLDQVLARQTTDIDWVSRDRLTATQRVLLEESSRQAQAGALDEAIAIGESALLLDVKLADVRWLLLGAYRRQLQRVQGTISVRTVEGVRVDASPRAVVRQRLRHHGEYLIRNALVDRSQAAYLLQVLDPPSNHGYRRAEPDHGRTLPPPHVRYADPAWIRDYRDQALELLERAAEVPEVLEEQHDEILLGYALGPMHRNWQDAPNQDRDAFETGLWVQRAIELKDRIHYLAARIDPDQADERAALDDWAIAFEEQVLRNAVRIGKEITVAPSSPSPYPLPPWERGHRTVISLPILSAEELGFFVLRNFDQSYSASRFYHLDDHPEIRERYRGLYERLAAEEDPALQLSGRLGLFGLDHYEMLRSTGFHPPLVRPDPIHKARRHLEPILRLAKQCGLLGEDGWTVNSPRLSIVVNQFDSRTKLALRMHDDQSSAASGSDASAASGPPSARPIVNPADEGDVPRVTARSIPGFEISQWLEAFSLDDGTDLICEPTRICLMTAPGELTTIFRLDNHASSDNRFGREPPFSRDLPFGRDQRGFPSRVDWIYRVHYDGRWIWVMTGDLDLLAIDRQGEIAGRFQLPPFGGPRRGATWREVHNRFADGTFRIREVPLAITSYRPGQVWLTGVEQKRTSVWVGRASIAERGGQAGGEFEVVFRAARRAPDSSLDAQLPMDVFFYPNNSLNVFDLKEHGRWLVIPRSDRAPNDMWADPRIHSFLWLDVDNPKRMRVDRTSVTNLLQTRGNTRPLVYLEDAILVARHEPLPAVRGTTILARLALTGGDPLAGEVNWRKEIIAQRTDFHGTAWLFDGRKLHCFCRRHWMVIDPQTLETETFATDFEALGIAKLSPIPFYNPFFSAHYGILVPTEVERDRQRTLELFQIRFP